MKINIIILLCLIALTYFSTGCDPFNNKEIPLDINGTWSGSILEGAKYSSITLKLSHSGTLVTGSWTTLIHGTNETGGLSGSYYDGKAYFTLSLGDSIIGNMKLKFDRNNANGTGTERGNDFEVKLKKI